MEWHWRVRLCNGPGWRWADLSAQSRIRHAINCLVIGGFGSGVCRGRVEGGGQAELLQQNRRSAEHDVFAKGRGMEGNKVERLRVGFTQANSSSSSSASASACVKPTLSLSTKTSTGFCPVNSPELHTHCNPQSQLQAAAEAIAAGAGMLAAAAPEIAITPPAAAAAAAVAAAAAAALPSATAGQEQPSLPLSTAQPIEAGGQPPLPASEQLPQPPLLASQQLQPASHDVSDQIEFPAAAQLGVVTPSDVMPSDAVTSGGEASAGEMATGSSCSWKATSHEHTCICYPNKTRQTQTSPTYT